VVAPETCGLGGDLFALIHRPGWERPRTLNSSGRAGSGADAEALRAAGHREVPLDHPAVVTVPGCVDGLVTLAEELGTRPLGDLLAPAIELASSGFEVSEEQARAFSGQAPVYRDNPAVSDFYPGGEPVSRGDRVTRAALARTLGEVADGGREAFYQSRAGVDISEAVGGMITPDDLARSQAEWVEPIGVKVRGLTAWTTPPNSQGYLGPATLAVFDGLGPPPDPDSPDWWHLLIESYRCLAWERDDLVSDPGTVAMPPSLLLDPERLARLSTTVTSTAGSWPLSMGSTAGTAYMCVADSEGMGVSIIQSNYRGTGSPFGAARSGFLLHDRGLGFGLTPGHPNELAPGKRPLHTLSPTLWTEGDRARWIIGTRGGSIQPQLVAQMAARVVGTGTDIGAAQDEPRWVIADFGPGSGSSLQVEPGMSPGLLADLRRRGHVIEELASLQPGWGPVSVIGLEGEARATARDPRVDTTAALVF
jgi:gamma-glutamyltranspeptidase/glutathione hydrolase